MSFRPSISRQSLSVLMVVFALVLTGCSNKNKNPKNKVLGERLSVLSFERELEADPALINAPVTLPRPYKNMSWSQPGGNLSNVHHHLSIGDTLTVAWKKSIGRGSSKYERVVASPVAANGIIYTIDSRALVRAMRMDNGGLIWQKSLKKRKKEEASKVAFGGGVALDGNTVYVTTGYGFVVALDGDTGQELWRQELGVPIRGAPTVADGKLFATTHDNQLFALSTRDGEIVWDHISIVENAGILGAASPAVSGDIVVAAFSSGELFALRTENGQVTWQDALSRTGRITALATLNDIDGQPVIDRGRVYAISHAGRMVSIDMRSGERVWESNIGGISTPWIAGDYIFVVSINGEVAALSLRDGRVRWVTQLQRFEKPEKRKGVIRWVGPILAGDRLIVVSSQGYILTVSPYTGEILSGDKLSDGAVISPIVVDNTLFVLTEDGRLTAYR